jgi:hypothetical protein
MLARLSAFCFLIVVPAQMIAEDKSPPLPQVSTWSSMF